MGFNPFKPIKKAVKGITKTVKKVVKGVVKVGKSLLKPLGKIMNKLGPLGMLAVGVMIPGAIGWMAAQGGAIGAIGTSLQAVGAAVSAPFKMLGQTIGKGISALGESIGTGLGNIGANGLGEMVTQMGNKIGNLLGYEGGTLSDSWKAIKSDVATKWDEAFGTSYSTPLKRAPITMKDAITGETLTKPPVSPTGLESPSNINLEDLKITTPKRVDPFAPTTTDKVLTAAVKAGTSLLAGGAGTGMGGLTLPELNKSPIPQEAVRATSPFGVAGAGGSSFYGQDQTGLLTTEELMRQQQSLLSRRYA